MEYLKQETKAGVLITVSFGILCFFLFNVTGMKDRAEMNHYAVTFSNINGLMENAPVTFAGVNVGKVEWIKIKSQTEGAVDVGISVRTSIKLNEDSRVMISSAGFVGEKFVSIMPVVSQKPALESGATLRGIDPTDMVKLIERVNTILSDFKAEQLGNSLKAIADDTHKTILHAEESFASIKSIVTEVQQSGKVQKVVNDASDLIVNLNDFARNANDTVSENRAAIKTSIANFEQLTSRAKTDGEKMLDQMREVMKTIEQIVRENRGDIRETIQNTKDFTYVVKHEPWRLFWKETSDGMLKERDVRKREEARKKGKPKGFPFIF